MNKLIEKSQQEKKSLDGLNIKMAMTERASELEDRPTEPVQGPIWRTKGKNDF